MTMACGVQPAMSIFLYLLVLVKGLDNSARDQLATTCQIPLLTNHCVMALLTIIVLWRRFE